MYKAFIVYIQYLAIIAMHIVLNIITPVGGKMVA